MLCFFCDCIAVDKYGELMTSTVLKQSQVSVKVHLYLTLDTFSSRVCSVVVNSRSLINKNIYSAITLYLTCAFPSVSHNHILGVLKI